MLSVLDKLEGMMRCILSCQFMDSDSDDLLRDIDNGLSDGDHLYLRWTHSSCRLHEIVFRKHDF